jgi:hypothetical protein
LGRGAATDASAEHGRTRNASAARGALLWLRSRPAAILAMAFPLLVLVHAGANPPWAAPDEPAQQIKAAALARGQLGARPRYDRAPLTFDEAFFRRLTRTVALPPTVVPPQQLPCFALRSAVRSGCLDEPAALGPWALDAAARVAQNAAAGPAESIDGMIAGLDAVDAPGGPRLATSTYYGVYPPFAYALPGLAGRLGTTPRRVLYLGRLANATLCGALLALGTVVGAGGVRGRRLLGPLLAVTPMVAFVSGTLSASGAEIASAYCCAAGLLALRRARPTRGAWPAVACGALGLAGARQLGPGELAVLLGSFAAVAGRRRLVALWAARPRWLVSAGAGVAALGIAMIWWDMVVMPRPPDRAGTAVDYLHNSIHDLPDQLREFVGVLGWLDTRLPSGVYLAWAVAAALAFFTAVAVGTSRSRVVLVGAVLGLLVVTIVYGVLIAYPTGSRAQGRWVLPLAVGLPLLAGEVAAAQALWRRWTVALTLLSGLVAAGSHLIAIVTNARRYAGPALADWTPPLGWVPWFVVAVVGAVGILTATLLSVMAQSWDDETNLTTTNSSDAH